MNYQSLCLARAIGAAVEAGVMDTAAAGFILGRMLPRLSSADGLKLATALGLVKVAQ